MGTLSLWFSADFRGNGSYLIFLNLFHYKQNLATTLKKILILIMMTIDSDGGGWTEWGMGRISI